MKPVSRLSPNASAPPQISIVTAKQKTVLSIKEITFLKPKAINTVTPTKRSLTAITIKRLPPKRTERELIPPKSEPRISRLSLYSS